MSARARSWLASRAGAVPPQLEAAMENAVDEVADDIAVPHALAAAARVCLVRALHDCDDRSAALPLLAADALMTFACEAAADGDGADIMEFAASWAPERLALMLTDRGSSS